MNFYYEIKQELINNESYKKIKDYSKNKNDLITYYNVGKLLAEAGKSYGQEIIKKYADKLVVEVQKKYNERTLRRMKQFFETFKDEKWSTMSTVLNWSHYVEFLSLKDKNAIKYYIKITENYNLSVRELRIRIKNKEYERLPKETKNKLMENAKIKLNDLVKDPIIIRDDKSYDKFSEKILQKLVLEDISSFLKELGEGFSFVDNEYKIRLGDRYNYIDLLLFNIKFNCYVVIELKIVELKKDHIGQIKTYMNYIDKNVKTIYQENTIGIVICKKGNKFIMEYCSDERILSRKYILN